MLLTLSDDIELLKRLWEIYFSEGVFSRFASVEKLSDFVDGETDTIDFAIVDASGSIKDAKAVCDKLRALFPDVRIGVLSSKSLFADRISLISSRRGLIDFLGEITKGRAPVYHHPIFKIAPHETNALLLGYPLKLTRNEHKILLLLASEPRRVFSHDEIVSLAFSFSQNLSSNQLAVHVCNINKKASLISNRRLIINPHKNGYVINPEL